MTATSGTGLMFSIFDHYGPAKKGRVAPRQNGVLISMGPGVTTAYALYNLQERGRMLVGPQTELYEGMIIGEHNRDNDLVVNASREKQLTNIRASGSDEALILVPPVKMSLEQALEFIEEDELVEITPHHIRLRKKLLKENDRKRAERS
jgi:GTP-binding protein